MATHPSFEFNIEEDTFVLVKEPQRFRVLMHNDDYTSMDFVVKMLESIFHKTKDEAVTIMLAIHEKGIGFCGVFTQEIAETKILQVHNTARKEGFPLRCSLEEE